jgi:hypothetical protein
LWFCVRVFLRFRVLWFLFVYGVSLCDAYIQDARAHAHAHAEYVREKKTHMRIYIYVYTSNPPRGCRNQALAGWLERVGWVGWFSGLAGRPQNARNSCFGYCAYALWSARTMGNVAYLMLWRLQIFSVKRPNYGKHNTFHALEAADELCEAAEPWKT